MQLGEVCGEDAGLLNKLRSYCFRANVEQVMADFNRTLTKPCINRLVYMDGTNVPYYYRCFAQTELSVCAYQRLTKRPLPPECM